MALDGKLGRTNLVQHEIHTGDAKPVRQKLRIPPMHMQAAVDVEIDKMVEAGIIEPSQSTWASNLVCVKKKDGSIRICAGFRQVNQCLMNNSAYPLPKIEECLDSLSGSKFYATLDLAQGYHQVEYQQPQGPLSKAGFTRGCTQGFTSFPGDGVAGYPV